MKANLKVILSVVGIAALLASPAMAKQARYAKLSVVPSDARASVAPYGLNEGGPYTPSTPTSRYNTNRDFQNGSRG
jgi:DMSO/TMAO reductase YedYZ molybdopterin-dependent catalytic subunit